MEQTLATIGEKEFSLPEDPETAALAFLQKLTALGYAEFSIDKGELDTQHPIAVSPPFQTPQRLPRRLDRAAEDVWNGMKDNGLNCQYQAKST